MNSVDLLELFGSQCDDAADFLCRKVEIIRASTEAVVTIKSSDITKYDYKIGDGIIIPFVDEYGDVFRELLFCAVHIKDICGSVKMVYFVPMAPLCECSPANIYDTLAMYEGKIPEDILSELSVIEHSYLNDADERWNRWGNYTGKLNIPSQANVSKQSRFRQYHTGHDDILFDGLSTAKDKQRYFRWYCDTPSETSYNGGISGVNRNGNSQYSYSVYSYDNNTYILPLIAVTTKVD